MDIFTEVRALRFPLDQYVVVGSGIMQALGIREAADLDIVVAPELFEECRIRGWENHSRPNGEPGLRKGRVSLYFDVNCSPYTPTFRELIAESEIINGVRFISLEQLLNFKKAYNRGKDWADIKLIEAYLQTQ